MRPEFIEQFDAAKNDRPQLIDMMNKIDQAQRELKMNLARLSSEPRPDDPVGKERQTLIRRMTDKRSHLKTERQQIKDRLAHLKANSKTFNYIINDCHDDKFLHAFYAAAELTLDDETMNEVIDRATEIQNGK